MKVLNYTKDDNQFYPTPYDLASYIRDEYFTNLNRLGRNKVKVLDPSAGKGDLLTVFHNCELYAVEIDPHLQAILRSREIKVIGSDWMRYDGTEVFDIVVMNPPFFYAEDHFIKAIEHFKFTNTHIVCIMNAETVRNPTIRMQDYLSKHDIAVEYRESAFTNAERKTDVEIAICSIRMRNENSKFDDLIEELEFAKEEDESVIEIGQDIEKRNNFDIDREVRRYREDVENTKKVYSLFNSVVKKAAGTPFRLYMDCGEETATLDKAVRRLRQRYWNSIIQIDAFSKHMTNDDTWKMREFLSENDNLEFNHDNVYALLQRTIETAQESIESTVMSLFNSITNLHAYDDRRNNNVHLYDGWKTNNGIAVKRKFIIPVYPAMSREPITDYDKGTLDYRVVDKLRDVEMAISYFSHHKERMFKPVVGQDVYLNHYDGSSAYESNLLHIKLYKKGTAHITIKDDDALRRFNIFAGKKIGALPQDYGTKDKSEMSDEEIKVSKAFEGNKYKREDNIVAVNVIDFKA